MLESENMAKKTKKIEQIRRRGKGAKELTACDELCYIRSSTHDHFSVCDFECSK